MNTPSARATRDLLNALIVACHDDIRVHDATARLVTGERQHRLQDATRRREVFVEELGHLVRELGGTPSLVGSPLELVREWVQRARGSTSARCAGSCPTPSGWSSNAKHAAVSSDRDELRRRSVLL
jgi:hypothetical protein